MDFSRALISFSARCVVIVFSLVCSLAFFGLLKSEWDESAFIGMVISAIEWLCLLAGSVLVVTKAAEPLYIWLEEAAQKARSRRDNPTV